VLTHHATGFCKRQILSIVAAEAKAVARAQPGDGGGKRPPQPQQPIVTAGVRRGCGRRKTRIPRRFVRKRLEPAVSPDAIDVALREHGA